MLLEFSLHSVFYKLLLLLFFYVFSFQNGFSIETITILSLPNVSPIMAFLITLIFVIITFALIRAPDISTYIGMINGLFYGAGELILPSGKIELLCGVTILIFIEILIFEKSPLRNILINSMYSVLARTFGIVFLFLSILFLGYDETSAFIYFRY